MKREEELRMKRAEKVRFVFFSFWIPRYFSERRLVLTCLYRFCLRRMLRETCHSL